jgi:ferric iron reductase protein FhuF
MVIPGEKLLTSDLFNFLKKFGLAINSPHPKVTGSLFFKRYPLYMGAFYAMSSEDIALSIDFASFSLSLQGSQFIFHFPNLQLQKRTGYRNEWRTQLLKHIFRDHLTPLIQHLHQITNVCPKTLWSHVVIYLTYWYEKWIMDTTDMIKKNRFLEDFHYLKEMDGQIFGLQENPLQQKFTTFSHPELGNQTISIRPNCCYHYCLPNQNKCYTCPLLGDKERVSLYLKQTQTRDKRKRGEKN